MANIDIAGKLNAATAEGYIAEANQIHYAGGNGNVEDALKSMKTPVDDLNKNGRNWYRYGAVRASKLFSLTTAATSEDIKAALTDIAGNHPKQAGLDACITGHMWLTEYVMGGVVMVGWSGQGYILTYVGQLTPAPDVYACTITVSATDADGATTYAVVKSGTRVKVTEGAKLPDDVVNAQHYQFTGIVDGVTAADAMAQTPRALYYDKTAMTFVCLDQDGNLYKQWPEDFAPMSAYVTEFGEEPITGKLFWSEDEEAFYYYSAAEWYRVEDTYVRDDVAKVSDTLSEYMSAGYLTAPFNRVSFGVNEDFTAGADTALKDGEIIPWTGWLTLVLCYKTTDSAAKVKLTGYAGQTLGKCELIGETAVAATEEPRVVRITGEHDYNPKRNGASDACMAGSSYYVNVEVKSPNAGFTMLWAVVYESDEYGNPRRRGGSVRKLTENINTVLIPSQGFNATSSISTPIYNERTGFFELNGLTDVNFDTMVAIASDTEFNSYYPLNITRKPNIRTNKIGHHHYNLRTTESSSYLLYNYDGLEILAYPLPYSNAEQLRTNSGDFTNCKKLRAILLYDQVRIELFMQGANNIETCYLLPINTIPSISLSDQEVISYESINFMIENYTYASTPLSVTVHSKIYTKLSGSTIENWGDLKTKAEGKGVQLVAKGYTNYPFLTEVLWHSYAALDKKIEAAASGDFIYIHTQDKTKIDSSQQDNWGELVTLAAEKNITFAQAE